MGGSQEFGYECLCCNHRCPLLTCCLPACWASLPLVQYNFTVVEAGCTVNCTVLVFTSSTPDVNLTDLLPGTLVSSGTRGWCWL